MSGKIRLALFLEAVATCLTLWCLVNTTALSMTLFFSVGLPLYGLGAALYVWEVLLDLRHHRVL
ncbi:MAG: hypothetical protein ABR587_11515 [Candidatus Binatia bacterium]